MNCPVSLIWMHLDAFYNLEKHTYADALIQPAHQKDESKAFCDMVGRYRQFFLFRTKDIHSKGLVTNLPADEFPSGRIKGLYFAGWGVEDPFRKLKYTIGLSNFHAYKPEYTKQEIWAKLIAHNITESLINHTVVGHGENPGILYTALHKAVPSIITISIFEADANLLVCHATKMQ